MASDRDRLTEILKICIEENIGVNDPNVSFEVDYENIADHLLANGVIVPPCKVGEKAWFILELDDELQICEETVVDFSTKGFYYSELLDGTGAQILVPYEEIGKTVFFTKEEAEKALKELGK